MRERAAWAEGRRPPPSPPLRAEAQPMISPSLRARLSRIARGLAGAAPPPAPVALDAAPAPAPPPPLTRPFLVRFDPESCGRERTDPAGACWEVRPPAETLAEDAGDLLQARP